MPKCKCGCGQQARRAFLPGHDAKLRANLEKRVGGLLALRTLIEEAESYSKGKKNAHTFLPQVRSIFA